MQPHVEQRSICSTICHMDVNEHQFYCIVQHLLFITASHLRLVRSCTLHEHPKQLRDILLLLMTALALANLPCEIRVHIIQLCTY